MQYIDALLNYIHAVLIDGDWMNDWLTHLPAEWVPTIMWIGQLLAAITGA
jgi:hypothetical protein